MSLTLSNVFWKLLLVVFSLLTVVLMLASVAIYTLAERKIMASIQRRKGPNVVGFWGLLQPLADGLKLAVKGKLVPQLANKYLFNFAPLIILSLSLFAWLFIVFSTPASLDPKNFNFILYDVSSVQYDKIGFFKLIVIYCFDAFYRLIEGFYTTVINTSFNYMAVLSKLVSTLGISNVSVSILIILAISSLNVYSIILAGWSSNSKYAFLGSLRSAAQMISYEVSIGLTILPVILLTGNTLNLNNLILRHHVLSGHWSFFFLLPCVFVFFVSMLAETNRTPFDLTEAEAELVAGYNVEYSSIVFAMFFLAEYANMLLMSALITIFFFGAHSKFVWIIEMLCFVYLFVLVRATFPRYKYNELMDLGWKVFLPITLAFLVYVVNILVFYNAQLANNWTLSF